MFIYPRFNKNLINKNICIQPALVGKPHNLKTLLKQCLNSVALVQFNQITPPCNVTSTKRSDTENLLTAS